MIKNVDKIKKKMLKQSKEQIETFVDELQKLSENKEFTIDNIENLMTKFNRESKNNLIDSVDTSLAKFDESKLIEEKKTNSWFKKSP